MTTPEVPMAGHSGGHKCTCGSKRNELPVLDARVIPHEIRHAAIFGALDSLKSGQAMALIAPHDPKPLLAQVQHKYGDQVSFEYLEQGPEWKLAFRRS